MGDNISLRTICETLNRFENVSGLKVNKTKTEILKINFDEDTDYTGFTTKEEITITGMIIGHDKSGIEKRNFKPVVDKLIKVLNMWKGRSLSILGRVMAVKASGLSLFQFLASVIDTPKWVQVAVDKAVYSFVNGGPDRMSRSMAAKPIREGGWVCTVSRT